MNWEDLLNPKRQREKSSATTQSNDLRSAFKKDFDTVCNCTGLRRLQDKAQVFPLEKEDYARTRLTHSIEVMSIAESLGSYVADFIYQKETEDGKVISDDLRKKIQDIPTILRSAALLHDMGNPPFGHLGENIISEWFIKRFEELEISNDRLIVCESHNRGSTLLKELLNVNQKNDFMHFEGNAQLLRLITKLNYSVDEYGMNLSYPVLATIIKYPTQSTEISKNDLSKKKMGIFWSELEVYNDINKTLKLNNKRHPLVYLLEAADDIAYLSADIEDAHKKGIISLQEILDIFTEAVRKTYKDDVFISEILYEAEKYDSKWESLVKDMPGCKIDRDNYIMQRMRIYIKGKMISGIYDAFTKNYESIMDGSFNQELLDCSKAVNLKNIIKNEIEVKYIYYCPEIVKTKLEAHEILNSLLDKFVMSIFNAKNNGKAEDCDSLLYNMISDNYKFVCEKNCKDDPRNSLYYKLLLATDSISGMTDSYAKNTYDLLKALC